MKLQEQDIQQQRADHQVQLELLFSKNQLMQRIKQEFAECEAADFGAYFDAEGIPQDFGFALLTQMALHKRADLPTLVGCLRHLCTSGQEVADLLYKCAVADLVDWNPTLRIFIVKFTVSADVQVELDRFQYPLPMVVAPKTIKNNKQSGYYLNNSSIILKHNHHEDDVCLDHINRMNQVKFSINFDTATMIKNQWRNLDKPKEGETQADYDKRVRAFNKYDATAKDVIDILVKHGNEFYFTHRYDKRGRTYSGGYHVNYQGTAWSKAICEFADGEVTSG